MFEQERVIGRLQRRVLAEPAIMACFLGGSFGRRTEDDYSDLDVALVYLDDATQERAWSERRAFAQSVMPYVSMKAFDAEHIRPHFYVTLFANGCKVDYRFESAAILQPSPFDGRIRILKDTNDWAKAYQADSAKLSRPAPSIDSRELHELDQRYWIMLWDVLRLLARGDSDKPYPIYLQMLWATYPRLLELLPPADPARASLLNAYFSHDTQLTAKHLAAQMDAYLATRSAVSQRFQLQPTGDASFEAEILKLIQKLT